MPNPDRDQIPAHPLMTVTMPIMRDGVQVGTAHYVEASAYEKLQADSVRLNAVGYAMAKALGIAVGGEPVEVNIEDLLRRLVADRDRADECRRDMVGLVDRVSDRCSAMEPVVDAARVVAGCDWMKQGYTFDRAMAALADAVDRLDDPARAPLGHTETISAPDEYPGEGETGCGRFSGPDEALGDALRAIAKSNSITYPDPGRCAGVESLAVDNQTLREIAVKRWHKIERLRGKLYKARTEIERLRALIGGQQPAKREPRTEAELHRDEAHRGWEYRTTDGQRKEWNVEPPEGDGWEQNVDRDGGWQRFEYHEEAYWRRPKPASEVAE